MVSSTAETNQLSVLDFQIRIGVDDQKSTSGYMFQLGGTAISWRSKKQTCVASSTAEAEYMALASAAQEAMWLHASTYHRSKE